eukprot:TRINITY_DN1100_c0_g2_i2.p3 TRINITY_DN1100_c0_g2~~TRINITY_DN1100_c0_g2_i2.p3  ORF type:complete len:118 (-),score=17.69 TRINITY_DN1100_c0_g2_i2:372-725(-)
MWTASRILRSSRQEDQISYQKITVINLPQSLTKIQQRLKKMMEDDFNKVVDVIKEADKLWAVMKEEYDEYMGQMDSKIQTFQKNFKKYEAQFLKEIADIKKGASEQLDCLQQKLHIK